MPIFMDTLNSNMKENLSDNKVREFLALNPDFLKRNPDILESLDISHDSGAAVSLIQKQVELLRKSSNVTTNKLDTLLENAKNNEELLKIYKKLIINLLESNLLTDVIEEVETTFISDLGVTDCKVYFFIDEINNLLPVGRIKEKNLQREIENILKSKNNYFGPVNPKQVRKIFEIDSVIKNISILKLKCTSVSGVLVFGSHLEGKYNKNKDTIFLDFILEILSKIIDKKNI